MYRIHLNIKAITITTIGLLLLIVATGQLDGVAYWITAVLSIALVTAGQAMEARGQVGTRVEILPDWSPRLGLHWKVVSVRDGVWTYEEISADHASAKQRADEFRFAIGV